MATAPDAITPARWRQIRSVFEEALERPEPERAQFVASACQDDPAMYREVEALLASSDQASSFLEPGGESDARATSRATILPRSYPELPSYAVISVLGEGGMGTVYLAERTDGEFKRRVAVKVLRPGVDTADLVRRFRAERQILASIAHPNIAMLLDGGTTRDGRPFLVMEYVEGMRIDQYCESMNVGIVERLKLLLQVCSAVQFAHQNLVVHRDIKPANILVTPTGIPKLLDFGIAKLLNPDLSNLSGEVTSFGAQLMTPDYASPEQLRGSPVTTSSDVYSLGALLYVLLTGRRAYELKNQMLDEVLRIVCEQDPPRPSLAVRQPDRAKQLAGDLDHIVMMAMRKEPQHRYRSVEHLADDIRRHLDALPVTARRSTIAYRSSRFLRRRRGLVAATTAALLLAAVFAISLDQQRRRAAREAARAHAIATFLEQTLSAVDPRRALGTEPTVRELLEAAERKVGQPANPAAGAGLARAEETALRRIIGQTRLQLGQFREAEAQFRKVVQLLSGQSDVSSAELIDALTGLAASQIELGRPQEAEPFARQAVQLAESAQLPSPLVKARNVLARATLDGRRPAEAETVLQTSLALPASEVPEDAPERLEASGLLIEVRSRQSRYADAEELARETYVRAQSSLGAEHPVTLEAFDRLSRSLLARNKYAEVLALQEQFIQYALKVLGEEHVVSLHLRETYGETLRQLDRFSEARPVLMDVLDRETRVLGPRHPATLRTQHLVALLRKDEGAPAEAEQLLRQIAAVQREVLGPDHADTLSTELMIALTLYEQRNLNGSRDAYREVLPRIKAALGDHRTQYLVGMSNYAGILYRIGDLTGAEAIFRDSLAAHRRVYGDDHLGTNYNLMELATTLARLHRHAEAEEQYLAALSGFRKLFSAQPGHNRIRDALGRLIDLYKTTGNTAKAVAYQAQLDDALRQVPSQAR